MKYELSVEEINELSLGLNSEFGSNEGAIHQILEKLKICVRIGVDKEDGGVGERKGGDRRWDSIFPLFHRSVVL